MERDRIIRKAVKLLNPPPLQRKYCHSLLSEALDMIKSARQKHSFHRMGREKETRVKIESFRAALRRVQIKIENKSDLPDILRYGMTATGFLDHLDSAIELCDVVLSVQTEPPHRDIFIKKVAAVQAAAVLTALGHVAKPTENGVWCRLAAVLYDGKPKEDMRHACREINKRFEFERVNQG